MLTTGAWMHQASETGLLESAGCETPHIHGKYEANSTVERENVPGSFVMLAILGNAESIGWVAAVQGNASEWPSLHVKYRKRNCIVSDITGNVDKFSAIGVKINALSTGLDDSMIYIFEGSEATAPPPTCRKE